MIINKKVMSFPIGTYHDTMSRSSRRYRNRKYWYAAEDLFNSAIIDLFPQNKYCKEFFFRGCNNVQQITIVLGLYSNLVKYKAVTPELLFHSLKNNHLDILIYRKFKHSPTYCSKAFFDKHMSLCDPEREMGLDDYYITDDDHCPNCQTVGYITKKLNMIDMGFSCSICSVPVCMMCCNYNFDHATLTCNKCL